MVQEEMMCSMVSPSVPQILHLSMIDCKPHNYVFFIISATGIVPQHIVFLVQLDSLCFSEFKNINKI
jgi:hypothetical protein